MKSLAKKQLHITAVCEGQKSALSFLTAYKSHMAILSKTSLFSAKKKKLSKLPIIQFSLNNFFFFFNGGRRERDEHETRDTYLDNFTENSVVESKQLANGEVKVLF